jgi:hypothetical protein
LSSLERCPIHRGKGWKRQTTCGPCHIVLSRQVSCLKEASSHRFHCISTDLAVWGKYNVTKTMVSH